MGKIRIGPKGQFDGKNFSPEVIEKVIYVDRPIVETRTVEIIKEVPKIVEVIREIKVVEEKIVEVIKHVEVPVEKIVERIIKVPTEVIKEVRILEEKFIEKPIEALREIEKEVEKVIHKVPVWAWSIMGVQALMIFVLLIK